MSTRIASRFLIRLTSPTTLILFLPLFLVFATSTGCDLGTYENRAAEVIPAEDETSEEGTKAESPSDDDAQPGEESEAPSES